MHTIVGKAIAWLGGLVLLSAIAVNPWIGTYYQDHIENYADVMLNYLWWSLGLAALLVGMGLMAAKRKSEGWTGAAMLLATVSLILLADRALLVYFGLPYWVADPIVDYRHRPNTVRVLGSRMFPSKDNRLKGVALKPWAGGLSWAWAELMKRVRSRRRWGMGGLLWQRWTGLVLWTLKTVRQYWKK